MTQISVTAPLSITSVEQNTSYFEDRITLPGQEPLGGRPAAFGSYWNSPFDSPDTLTDYMKESIPGLRPRVFELADVTKKNGFIGVPSFLYYPSDLARNRRYHHFIVFNIYQGTSDQIRMQTRNTALADSALVAAGGLQFGGDLLQSKVADAVVLGQEGMAPTQIEDYFKRKKLELGPISEGRFTAWDRLTQGSITNLILEAASGKSVTQGALDGTWAALKAIFDATRDDVAEFVGSVFQREMMDMWFNEKDTNERGINGERIQKSQYELSSLVANKRFTIANEKSKDTISLYMPQKITMNDQLVYQEEEMGMAKTLLAALTGKRGAGSALIEKAGTNFVAGLINKATNLAGVEDFNLQAVRNAATRSVSNPRREVMFRDVGIRSHTFSFEFSPRNSDEARTVLNIIRMFRFHAYPGLRGGGGHFFTFPAEFQASFMAIDDYGVITENNNLPRLPRLALTTVSVDYSGGGDFKTFKDAIPAFIKVDLGFQEMEQLTSEHIIHGY